MEFVQLSAEQRMAFEEDGFLVVRNVLDETTLERVTQSVDRLARTFLDKPVVQDRPEYNQLDFRPGLLQEEPLFDLVDHSATVPLIMQLLSPNIHLHSTTLICKRPENPEAPPFRRGWHRDIRIPRDLGHERLPRVGIKICYSLTDFDQPNSGMTLMARKTHLRTSPLEIPAGHVDPRGVEVCDVPLKAGDALFFENRIFHTAAPNLSNRVSKVLMYGYSYRWMKQEVYLDPPAENLLEKADPITWQLLGGYRDIDTPAWALQKWAKRHNVCPQIPPWTVDV